MKRSPNLQKLVDQTAKQVFGRKPTQKCCVACGSSKVLESDFRTPLDYKEFQLSRMCQVCIDEIFGTDPY